MVFNISLFIGSDRFGIMQYHHYMYCVQVIMSADAGTDGSGSVILWLTDPDPVTDPVFYYLFKDSNKFLKKIHIL